MWDWKDSCQFNDDVYHYDDGDDNDDDDAPKNKFVSTEHYPQDHYYINYNIDFSQDQSRVLRTQDSL